ncbi:MAG TPA: hypothetical protein VEA19_02910, partial [Actinomycetota bacterium]|nr:hypothetical protein [Actinomycetota bacterium]
KTLHTKSEMVDRLAHALGGRVAEEVVFGDITTGAGNDIREATRLARKMVTEYGMSERIGPLTLGTPDHEVFLGRDISSNPDYSDQVAFEIDSEVRRLIDEAHDEALDILKANRKQLDGVALALIERETIEKEELTVLLEGIKKKKVARATNGQRKGTGMAVAHRSVRSRGRGKGGGTLR